MVFVFDAPSLRAATVEELYYVSVHFTKFDPRRVNIKHSRFFHSVDVNLQSATIGGKVVSGAKVAVYYHFMMVVADLLFSQAR